MQQGSISKLVELLTVPTPASTSKRCPCQKENTYQKKYDAWSPKPRESNGDADRKDHDQTHYNQSSSTLLKHLGTASIALHECLPRFCTRRLDQPGDRNNVGTQVTLQYR